MNRNGELAIVDDNGREREQYPVVYGAKIMVKDGDTRRRRASSIAEWDPYHDPDPHRGRPVRSSSGTSIEGVTMQEQFDEVTGLSRKVIIEIQGHRQASADLGQGRQTARRAQDRREPSLARYMPAGRRQHLVIDGRPDRQAGDVIAKIPRETTKTKDITGGLPRVAELFEARKPKEHAVITEIDGVVAFGKDTKGKRKVIVTPDDRRDQGVPDPQGQAHQRARRRPRARPASRSWTAPPTRTTSCACSGEKELAKYLVDEVQEVYRLQGVKINDKHIEIIVRQMLRRVRIKEVGDTNFLVGEQVEQVRLRGREREGMETGGRPATAEPLLLGITKASLSTESFISAASFQETTKVLTEAAISGKVDNLRGLKENVIMGRLIPAGTGLATIPQPAHGC